jgi:hypothetical protein
MYRKFVSAEFTWTTRQSWITQFENALKLIKDISDLKMTVDSRDTKPEDRSSAIAAMPTLTSKLLKILVDEYEYRWVNIINLIPFKDIGKISSVIEFLGDIDIEMANKCGGCGQTRISTINRVIDMIKRISLPKRIENNDLLINQKKELLRVIMRNWSNSIDRQIEKAETIWLRERNEERWNEALWHARIKQWDASKNRDKMKETEINEYKEYFRKKNETYQMSNKDGNLKQIEKAREEIEKALKQYLNEDQPGIYTYRQIYYNLIVEKLPSLGVLLSEKQQKYYDLIVEKSVLNKEKKKLITEISLLNHFKRLLEFESENQKRFSKKYKLRLDQTK